MFCKKSQKQQMWSGLGNKPDKAYYQQNNQLVMLQPSLKMKMIHH